MASRQQQEAGASLRPSEMSAGGALIDDADVTFKTPQFVLYDFNGKSQSKTCAAITLVTDDGEEHVEYLSAADPKHFAPSTDGQKCIPVGDKLSLNNNSKWALFVTSLINAGFAESEIGDNIAFLDGVRAHIKRKAAPKSWSSMGKRDDGRETTVLEVTELLDALPAKGAKGRAAGAAGSGAKAGASKGGAKASAAGDLDAELTVFVEKALAEAGGSLGKKDLVPAVFRLAMAHPQKKALMKRAFDDDFLLAGMAEGKWSFDGETVEAVE